MSRNLCIEFPARGETYSRDVYGVYEYSEYPASSVLAGTTRRRWMGEYPTVEEALAAHPGAVIVDGSAFVHDNLDWLPDEDGNTFTEGRGRSRGS